MNSIQRTSPALYGVLWICGYTGAGKTTVSTIVAKLLREKGASVVLLDGDKLREVYGGRWGYERHDRIELGYVNYRLCKYLSEQGHVVIIAAGGMYDEIAQWNRENIRNFAQVHLEVPDQERQRRDRLTKNVYNKVGSVNKLFDSMETADFSLPNWGNVLPKDTATRIVTFYLSHIGWADRND